MAFRSWNLLLLFWIILLWRFCKIEAYVDVCESPTGTMYCGCDEVAYSGSSSLYRVNCIVLQNISKYDSVWRSLGDSENISQLKLQPRYPITLEYIPSDDFRRMSRLRVLRIQEGNLGILQPYTLSDFGSLELLELQGNEIEALSPNAISNMPKLKKLTLSENSLQEILADSLTDLLSLEALYLDRNNISRIETCAFCNLQNLKELELFSNQISDLTEYTFRGLRYLVRLDLYNNRIRLLNDKVFHTLPRLIELDLRDNKIGHISARAFDGLDKLQTLTMGNNEIKFLPNYVFKPLLSIRHIDLSNNKLEILQKEVINSIINTKNEYFSISFRMNPLICDCAFQWVPSYIKLNNSRRLTRELEEAKCMLENETSIIEYLKSANCKMSTIKPRTPVLISKHLVTMSTDSVPIELNSQKSIPLATVASADGETEIYLSDIKDTGDMDDDDGANTISIHLSYVFCVALLVSYFTSLNNM